MIMKAQSWNVPYIIATGMFTSTLLNQIPVQSDIVDCSFGGLQQPYAIMLTNETASPNGHAEDAITWANEILSEIPHWGPLIGNVKALERYILAHLTVRERGPIKTAVLSGS